VSSSLSAEKEKGTFYFFLVKNQNVPFSFAEDWEAEKK